MMCIQYVFRKTEDYMSPILHLRVEKKVLARSRFFFEHSSSISPTNCVTSTKFIFDSFLRCAPSACVIASDKSQQILV